jgi:hypothetical protein
MIPRQENGLFPGDINLWPYQWWHERREHPSLLFILKNDTLNQQRLENQS